MEPENPSRGGDAAARCPVCQGSFHPLPNQRYCCKACRDTAWRRRHQATPAAVEVPAARPRRTFTVYECLRHEVAQTERVSPKGGTSCRRW